MITQARLKELMSYDQGSGQFTWLVSPTNGVPAGSPAGCRCKHHGYVFIRVDDTLYRAHRLAWLYVHGVWPPADIDHINGLRADNRFANLRAVTRAQNLQNMRVAKAKSGLLGAHSHRCGRWRSSITVDGVTHKLGWFSTAQEAHDAYLKAKAVLHPYRPAA